MHAIDLVPYWADGRALLLEGLDALGDEDLDLRPAPGLASIGQLLRHIITTEEHWWHGGILGAPWDAWRPRGWLAFGPEHKEAYRAERFPTLRAMRHGLAAARAPIDAFLREFEAERLCEKRRATWDEDNTLRWIVWHLVEHEQHHRAQIFTRMRLSGRRPPPLLPRPAVMASTPAERWTGRVDVALLVPYWKPLFASLREAVQTLTPADLEYRPAPELPSIGDLALHIIARCRELARRSADANGGTASELPAAARTVPVRRLDEAVAHAPATGSDLAAALEHAHEITQDVLDALTQTDLVRMLETPWGPQSLHHALWCAREHVVHHRAQLFFGMRMIERTPPAL